MSLREAIAKQHDAAEKHPLTAVMMAGELTPQAYADLLANQMIVYQAIEAKASFFGIDKGLLGYERAQLMADDLLELSEMLGGLEIQASKATAEQRAGTREPRRCTHRGGTIERSALALFTASR